MLQSDAGTVPERPLSLEKASCAATLPPTRPPKVVVSCAGSSGALRLAAAAARGL
jgi:hypothetical protein